MAEILLRIGRKEEAERLYRSALESATASLGPEHPDVAAIMNGTARMLRERGRKSEAKELEKSAKLIFEKHSRRNLLGHVVDVRELAKRDKYR